MHYLIEPRVFVNSYEFLSFAKNIGKNLTGKYSQTLLDIAKKSAVNALKTALKRAIQKTAEATGDLIGNEIADKITRILSQTASKTNTTTETEDVIPKEIYISSEKRQQIIGEPEFI